MKTIKLTKGMGEKGKSHCVMAATSIVADEDFTDHPKCVSPTITSALIILNDSYESDNVARESALGHLPWLIIGTRGSLKHEQTRAFLFADWAVRICCGVKCDPITDYKTACAAATAAVSATAAARAANAAAAHAAHAATAAARAATDAACAARVATAASAAADAAGNRNQLIAYIELVIIPVFTTMTIEPDFNIDRLIKRPINHERHVT